MIKGLKIFDCTLREVGYQTGWHFTDKFVRDAYKFAQGKGIDYLELGFFHQEAADPDRGIYRYCSTKNQGLGYEVFINFTSAGYNSIDQNIRFAQFAKDKGVHAIEFADTESVMTEDYVKNTIRECHKIGIEMGVHLHDKNGTAENLADLAIAEGADYMDVTHVGLGGKWRDGNVTMEYLLRKLGIGGGYEATMIRNEMIEELIQFHPYSAAE